MSVDKMKRRPNIPQEWPAIRSETEASWSNRLVAKGVEYGVYRQCSIGWHAECSQRQIVGESCPCRCYCHVLHAKRFSDAELAAEHWHSVAREAESELRSRKSADEIPAEYWRRINLESAPQTETVLRFATLPNYDEVTK